MNDDNDTSLLNRAASKVKSGTKKAGRRAWEEMKESAEDLDEPESRGRSFRREPVERDSIPRFGDDAEDYDDYDEGVGMTGGLGVGMEDDGDPLSFGDGGDWGMGREDEEEEEYDDWLGGW